MISAGTPLILGFLLFILGGACVLAHRNKLGKVLGLLLLTLGVNLSLVAFSSTLEPTAASRGVTVALVWTVLATIQCVLGIVLARFCPDLGASRQSSKQSPESNP